MENKSSLVRYRESKSIRGQKDVYYDNSRGSALLALARAGKLPSRSLKCRFNPTLEDTCTLCGMCPETLEHVIFECNDGYFNEEDLHQRLGFAEDRNHTLINKTRSLLQKWEIETGSAENTRL